MKQKLNTTLRLFLLPVLIAFTLGAHGEALNKAGSELKPSVQKLKDLIDTDPIIRMYFTQMIEQVPLAYENFANPGQMQKLIEGYPEPYRYLKSIDEMLILINDALGRAPEYNQTGLVGFPINGVLNWTMAVPGGFSVFRLEKVNAVFKEILDEYGTFLDSPASRSVLKQGSGSWRSTPAMDQLVMDQYIYDPEGEYWGFKSWNDFFTRVLKPGARPIAEPDNNKVIVSACDSTVYDIQYHVEKSARFWIKEQPYSLIDMLAGDEFTDQFVGGDVYQAFLSAVKYHRWHSPVKGTIKKAFIKQGTYYSETESQGLDPSGPNLSQGYITHVATRAIIFIEADDPQIGLMCIMPVGMAEVSSCVLGKKIKPGYKIEKGEELGYFQFGGSTYCLIFRPGAIKGFELKPGDDVKMGQKIATAH